VLHGGEYVVRLNERPDKVSPPKSLTEGQHGEWWGRWRSHYLDRHEALVKESDPGPQN
jgi:hypothetical protein